VSNEVSEQGSILQVGLVHMRSKVRDPSAVQLLAVAYALGVVGTIWDWHDHLVGPGTQRPHIVIDLGGLLVLGVLAFSGKTDFRSRSFMALYALVVVVALIALGPFVLMMAAPRSTLMASLMHSMMSSGALLAYAPLVIGRLGRLALAVPRSPELVACSRSTRHSGRSDRHRLGSLLASDPSDGSGNLDGRLASASADLRRIRDRFAWRRLRSDDATPAPYPRGHRLAGAQRREQTRGGDARDVAR